MNVFPALLAGHLLGDFLAQTDWQAATKVRPDRRVETVVSRYGDDPEVKWRDVRYFRSYWESWRANQLHMVSYHVTLLAALLVVWHDGTHLGRGLVIVSVSWLTHSVIDRRWPVRWLMARTGSGPFSETTFGVIAVDQALHLSILSLLSYLG